MLDLGKVSEEADTQVEIDPAEAEEVMDLPIQGGVHPFDVTVELLHLSLQCHAVAVGDRTDHLFCSFQLPNNLPAMLQQMLLTIGEEVVTLIHLIHHACHKSLYACNIHWGREREREAQER